MIWGFILLLALPLAIKEFAPGLGNKIVSLFYGPDITAFAYFALLAFYGFFWFLKILADKEKAQKEQKAWLLKNIKKTKLISVDGQGSESFTSTSGAIGRAAIGSLVAGPVGGIIGASTAKTHTTTTNNPSKYMFMVYYKDGTRESDTVTEKDWKFRIYIDYIDLGNEEPEQYIEQKDEQEEKKEEKKGAQYFAYCPAEGEAAINVILKNATLWMNRKDIAELFKRSKDDILVHIKNLFDEGEFSKETDSEKMVIADADGKMHSLRYYNLDVILTVGYRIDGRRASVFRIWATDVLHENTEENIEDEDDF